MQVSDFSPIIADDYLDLSAGQFVASVTKYWVWLKNETTFIVEKIIQLVKALFSFPNSTQTTTSTSHKLAKLSPVVSPASLSDSSQTPKTPRLEVKRADEFIVEVEGSATLVKNEDIIEQKNSSNEKVSRVWGSLSWGVNALGDVITQTASGIARGVCSVKKASTSFCSSLGKMSSNQIDNCRIFYEYVNQWMDFLEPIYQLAQGNVDCLIKTNLSISKENVQGAFIWTSLQNRIDYRAGALKKKHEQPYGGVSLIKAVRRGFEKSFDKIDLVMSKQACCRNKSRSSYFKDGRLILHELLHYFEHAPHAKQLLGEDLKRQVISRLKKTNQMGKYKSLKNLFNQFAQAIPEKFKLERSTSGSKKEVLLKALFQISERITKQLVESNQLQELFDRLDKKSYEDLTVLVVSYRKKFQGDETSLKKHIFNQVPFSIRSVYESIQWVWPMPLNS